MSREKQKPIVLAVVERLVNEGRPVLRAEFNAEHGGAKAAGAIRWLGNRGIVQADRDWVELGPKFTPSVLTELADV